MLHAGDAREHHRLDVGARAADFAVPIDDLVASDHGEVERSAAALALLVVPLTLAARLSLGLSCLSRLCLVFFCFFCLSLPLRVPSSRSLSARGDPSSFLSTDRTKVF